MRLATLSTPAGPRAAVLDGDHYVDLHATDCSLPSSVRGLLAAGPDALRAAANAANHRGRPHPASASAVLLPPVPDPAKILCIGLNYRDHAMEGNRAIPTEPVLFGKFPNTLIAHGDPIRLPKVARRSITRPSWSSCIGKSGQGHPESRPRWATSPATPSGTTSRPATGSSAARRSSGSSARRSTRSPRPGPHLVTADEVPDPHSLQIHCGSTARRCRTRTRASSSSACRN